MRRNSRHGGKDPLSDILTGYSTVYDRLGDLLVEGLDPDSDMGRGGEAHPLPGSEQTWQEWLANVAPHIDQSLMAAEHIALWEWIDGLTPGERPPAFLADWPRGYGKTTTMRLAMARLCTTVKRRFGLYVCASQTVANNHINSIRQRFEEMGVGRLEDQYGYSLGWNGERLRTANGFTLIALGLDQSNIRGLNLHDLRPDFIVGDDIDDLNDSVDATDKKRSILTQTVFQAGSADRAILLGQNEIHANSVMHGFVSGETDALRRRVVSKVVAVDGFKCALVPNTETGQSEWRITAGQSTWPGKSLEAWEADLNESGELAFRRECQHELGAGGLFFPNFAPSRLDTATGELTPWHVVPMPRLLPYEAGGFRITPYADFWGSHDYGEGKQPSAACSHVWHVDQWGVVTVIAEEYGPDRTSKQQALGLLLQCNRLGIGEVPPARRDDSVPGGIVSTDTDGEESGVETLLERIAFDHANTFPPEGNSGITVTQRQGEYPVEVWHRYGLPAIRAVKDVIAGLRTWGEWLLRTVTYPDNHPDPAMRGRTVAAFRIAEGAAPMLQGYLEKALKDPKDSRYAVAPARYEHAGDSGRYGIMTRPDACDDPTKRRGYRSGVTNLLTGERTATTIEKVGASVMKPAVVTGDKWLDEREGDGDDWTY
jgi:hypothetical protein